MLPFASTPASAADQPGVGVLIGTNIGSAALSGADAADIATGSKAGLNAGVFARWPLTARLAVQPEVAFAQKPFRLRDEAGTFSATEQWDWIEIPVLARIEVWHRAGRAFFLVAGPGFGIRLRAREQVGQSSSDVSADIQPVDATLTGGAGFSLGKAGLELRYEDGLRNLNRAHRLGEDLRATTRALTVNLTWRLR